MLCWRAGRTLDPGRTLTRLLLPDRDPGVGTLSRICGRGKTGPKGDGELRGARLVERAADDLAGQRVGQFALVEQHAAVDHDVVDTDRVALDLHAARGQVRDRLAAWMRS